MNSSYIQRLNNKNEISLDNSDDVYKKVIKILINKCSLFRLIRLINFGALIREC